MYFVCALFLLFCNNKKNGQHDITRLFSIITTRITVFARNAPLVVMYPFKQLLIFVFWGISGNRQREKKSRPRRVSIPGHLLQQRVSFLLDNGDAFLKLINIGDYYWARMYCCKHSFQEKCVVTTYEYNQYQQYRYAYNYHRSRSQVT